MLKRNCFSASERTIRVNLLLNELDLRALWKEFDEYEKELGKEAKSLEEVWVTMEDLKNRMDESMAKYGY
jgi:hypothetical protein